MSESVRKGVPNPCDELLCSLCGRAFEADPELEGDKRSREHVLPKQFYPKEIRQAQQMNFWMVPSHIQCNQDYRKDEEYFYHSTYALVQNNNRKMGQSSTAT